MDVLTEPLLASDGYTYNASTLVRLMDTDEWHKSPVTGEVLREWAYPNVLVSQHLGCAVMPPMRLYTDVDTVLPSTGKPFILGLPTELSAEDEIARHALRLPAEPIVFMAKLSKSGPGQRHVFMHPPCPEAMRADTRALAILFGYDAFVTNPWCVSTAVLQFGSSRRLTVEAWWLRVHAPSPRRHGLGDLREGKLPTTDATTGAITGTTTDAIADAAADASLHDAQVTAAVCAGYMTNVTK